MLLKDSKRITKEWTIVLDRQKKIPTIRLRDMLGSLNNRKIKEHLRGTLFLVEFALEPASILGDVFCLTVTWIETKKLPNSRKLYDYKDHGKAIKEITKLGRIYP